MALSLSASLTQSSDCKTLTFADTTGLYSSANTDGWSHGFAITASETSTNSFTIAVDPNFDLAVGDTIEVIDSTADDGTWTVSAITYTSTHVAIFVTGGTVSNNGNGTLVIGGTVKLNSEVETASISITNLCSGVTYDAIDFKTDLQADSSRDIALNSSHFGLTSSTAQIPDGFYQFTYTVVGTSGEGGNSYSYTTNQLLVCILCCKVSVVAASYAVDSCNCVDKASYKQKVMDILLDWMALKQAPVCGNINQVCDLLTSVQNQVAQLDCENC